METLLEALDNLSGLVLDYPSKYIKTPFCSSS
jgi:hypothetical protein